jgi:hypothetical protein
VTLPRPSSSWDDETTWLPTIRDPYTTPGPDPFAAEAGAIFADSAEKMRAAAAATRPKPPRLSGIGFATVILGLIIGLAALVDGVILLITR